MWKTEFTVVWTILQQTEENKVEIRIDIDDPTGKGHERLQLYIDDHTHDEHIHDCPHFDDLDEE